jgi:hypothetical protein
VSTVNGNVSQVEASSGGAAARAAGPERAAAGIAGIRVHLIEVPGVEATTNEDGEFTLSGGFAGPITLQFDAPQRMPANLALDVPAGATIVLQDIVLRGPVAEPQAIRQRGFVGAIAARPVCHADGTGALLVHDEARRPNRFPIQITADTDIFRRGSAIPLTCGALTREQRVAIDAEVRPDRSIVAQTIIISPHAGSAAPPGTSRVAGNVVDSHVPAGAPLAGVQVRVLQVRLLEAPDAESVTNAEGQFLVEGAFAGSVTVQFEPPRRAPATLALEVPAGSTLVLREVALDEGTARARLTRVRDFAGIIAAPPECAADGTAVVLVNDSAKPPNQFRVLVVRGTVIQQRMPGGPMRCGALHRVHDVDIEGTVQSDGSIVAETIAAAPG